MYNEYISEESKRIVFYLYVELIVIRMILIKKIYESA